jgi:hypothetical protein
METKGKRTKVIAGILALAGLLGLLTLAIAGDLEPSAPPAPTMKTLDEIYNVVVAGSSDISQREGRIDHNDVAARSSITLFTVQTGKQFVLLKMVLHSPEMKMYLTKNGNFLTGRYYTCTADGNTFMDFPDRCVVLNAGDSLGIKNESSSAGKAMVVGYFCNVQ